MIVNTGFHQLVTVSGLVLLQMLVAATAILLLAAATVLLLQSQSAALRHRVWTLAMAALLGLPLLTVLLPGLGPAWYPDFLRLDIPSRGGVLDANPISTFAVQPGYGTAVRSVMEESAEESGSGVGGIRSLDALPSGVPGEATDSMVAAGAELPRTPADANSNDVTSGAADRARQHAAPATAGDVVGSYLWSGFLGVWLVGVVVGLMALARCRRTVTQVVRRGVPVTDAGVVGLEDQLRESAGVGFAVPLLCSSETVVPLTVGCVRPVIVLPVGYGQWTAERCRVVLAHEMAHICRRDVLTQLIARLACVLYWCHPFVWLASWRMRVEREFACDDAVLQMGELPGPYASHLVDVAGALRDRSKPPRGAVAMASRSTLEQRVRAILQPFLKRTPVTRRSGRILAAATLAVVVTVSMMSPSTSQDVEGGPSAEDTPITVDAHTESTDTADEKSAASSAPAAEPKISADGYVSTSGSMRIRALDPDGRPFPDVTVYVSRKEYATGKDGIAEIEIPKRLDLLRVWVRTEGHVPMFLQWWPGEQPDGHLIPEEYTVRLPRGTVVGGVVKNEEGEPIEGVIVEVKHEFEGLGGKVVRNQRPRIGTWLAYGSGAKKTDAQGQWSLNNVPTGDEGEVRVKLSHPDYIDDETWGGLQREQFVSMGSLRDQTAVIVMKQGISLTGTLTDPEGKPVPDAIVIWGDRPYWQTGSQEVRTDKQGVYRFPPLPPGPMTVTVVAEGWMPELTKIEIQPEMSPVDFQLQPGKLLRLRFVDSTGNPVPDVGLGIDSWRGGESLYNVKHPNVLDTRIPRRANNEGLYVWSWAPADAVKYRFGKIGYAEMEASITADGQVQTMTLHPLLNVSGSVTDATTGEDVDRFQVVPVTYFRPEFLSVNRNDAVEGSKGQFEIEFSRTDIKHGIQIEVEGYRTQPFGLWKIGDANPVLQIKLEPAAPIQGVVVGTGGQPVPDARVYLGTHTQDLDIINHDKEDSDSSNFLRNTDTDGQFRFPAQYEPYALVVIHDSGYADILCSPGDRPGQVQIQPWARVEGRVLHDGRPVAHQRVRLDPLRPRFHPLPRISETFWQTTDKEGRFVFERVPPVKSSLSAYLTVWEEFPITSSQSVPLDLQPGQNLTIDLNGDGAEVTGRVLLSGEPRADIDLNYSLNYLLALRDGIEPPQVVAAKGFDWKDGWSDAWTGSPEGQVYRATLHHYFVKLNRDGTFHISGVPPGEYELALKIYEPPQEGCLVQPIATRHVRVEVTDADLAGGVALGDVKVQAIRGPELGDPVADFTFESLDGSSQALSDLRGHYVLIDVWATWCASCLTKLPVMREIQSEFAGNEQLELLGINLDRDRDKAKQFVQREQLPWRQGFLGDWSESAFATQYRISSIPTYLLIDPDGKLVHKGHNVNGLRKVLEGAPWTTRRRLRSKRIARLTASRRRRCFRRTQPRRHWSGRRSPLRPPQEKGSLPFVAEG